MIRSPKRFTGIPAEYPRGSRLRTTTCGCSPARLATCSSSAEKITRRAKPVTPASATRGLSKIAAYRDDHGTLHECSAVCPHLGCIVRWNDTEKSWDCPCHGSRFDRFGTVINGPANRDLGGAD